MSAEVRKRLASWETELHNLLEAQDSSSNYIVRCYDSLSSTMDVAKEHFEELDQENAALVLTKNQTGGRGRQGRVWSEVDEGFYGTYVFKSNSNINSLTGLSLAVGCVLCDTLKSYTTDIGLKWPNDVLGRSGSKLCGTLIELSQFKGEQFVLIGIGINLVGSPENVDNTTSLFDLSGRVVPPVEIAGSLSRNLFEAWKSFKTDGFAMFRDRWMEDALFFGSQISVQVAESPISGTFLGVDQTGAMLLETPTGTIPVTAGHVISVD